MLKFVAFSKKIILMNNLSINLHENILFCQKLLKIGFVGKANSGKSLALAVASHNCH